MNVSSLSASNITTTHRDPMACQAFMLWLMRQPGDTDVRCAARSALDKMRVLPKQHAWQYEFQAYLEQVASSPTYVSSRRQRTRLQ